MDLDAEKTQCSCFYKILNITPPPVNNPKFRKSVEERAKEIIHKLLNRRKTDKHADLTIILVKAARDTLTSSKEERLYRKTGETTRDHLCRYTVRFIDLIKQVATETPPTTPDEELKLAIESITEPDPTQSQNGTNYGNKGNKRNSTKPAKQQQKSLSQICAETIFSPNTQSELNITTQPATQPTTQPTTQPAAQPTTQPTTQPKLKQQAKKQTIIDKEQEIVNGTIISTNSKAVTDELNKDHSLNQPNAGTPLNQLNPLPSLNQLNSETPINQLNPETPLNQLNTTDTETPEQVSVLNITTQPINNTDTNNSLNEDIEFNDQANTTPKTNNKAKDKKKSKHRKEFNIRKIIDRLTVGKKSHIMTPIFRNRSSLEEDEKETFATYLRQLADIISPQNNTTETSGNLDTLNEGHMGIKLKIDTTKRAHKPKDTFLIEIISHQMRRKGMMFKTEWQISKEPNIKRIRHVLFEEIKDYNAQIKEYLQLIRNKNKKSYNCLVAKFPNELNNM